MWNWMMLLGGDLRLGKKCFKALLVKKYMIISLMFWQILDILKILFRFWETLNALETGQWNKVN